MRRKSLSFAVLGAAAAAAWFGTEGSDAGSEKREPPAGGRPARPVPIDLPQTMQNEPVRPRDVARELPIANPSAAPTADGRRDDEREADAAAPSDADPAKGQDPDPRTVEKEEAPLRQPEYPEGVRYQVRWGQTGLCNLEGLEDVDRTRAGIHATFAQTIIDGIDLRHDIAVPAHALAAVARSVPQAQAASQDLLGFGPPPPTVFVYVDLEQLRSAACVNQASVAYYDGDLHVTGDFTEGLDQIHQSVLHEYIHHSLLTWGISEPQWLQEGLAMYAAEETWWQSSELGLVEWLRHEHLPFELMTRAFPHTADELFAGAAYYQSYRMVHFIVWRYGEAAIAEVAASIAAGTVTPEGAFVSASGMMGSELEATWSEYVATP